MEDSLQHKLEQEYERFLTAQIRSRIWKIPFNINLMKNMEDSF